MLDIFAGRTTLDAETRKSGYAHHSYYCSDLFGTTGRIDLFPGCCGYAIYREVHSKAIEKNTEGFKEILKDNFEESRGLGAFICTVTQKGLVELLKENGWEKTFEHVNAGTGRTIYTLQLTL